MFDRIEHKTESTVVAVTKEIEKTISPDKVTEMYDKVRDEVLKTILRTYTFETDTIKGAVVEYVNQLDRAGTKYYARYELNDKEYVIEGELQMEERANSAYSIIEKIHQHYAKEVAKHLIKENIRVHERLTNGIS